MALPWIVRFYGEEAGPDLEGRTLDDILSFANRELEYNHDYIQILFPLPERSPFNPGAPVLDKPTRDAFGENESLRDNLFMAFQRMVDFYAFDVSGNKLNPILTPKDKFRRLARQTWLTRMDHNHLRITRIIRCLRILHLEPAAHAFLDALKSNEGGIVSPRSIMYWHRAAYRPLHLPPDEARDDAEGISWLRSEAATQSADEEEAASEGQAEHEQVPTTSEQIQDGEELTFEKEAANRKLVDNQAPDGKTTKVNGRSI